MRIERTERAGRARGRSRVALGCWLVVALAVLPAAAMGPVDGEVGLDYWVSETEVASGASGITEDSASPGIRAELWFFNKLGVSGSMYEPQPEGALDGSDTEYLNLDIKYRLISPTDKTFLAVGGGWESVDFGATDTSGPRIVVEGRVGFAGLAYAYGRGAYLPVLEDFGDAATVEAQDGTGREVELGVAVEPSPFFSVWAGYRTQNFEFDQFVGGVAAGELTVDNDGFVAGVGFHF